MFKHANQLFPGDSVRRQGKDKTAAPISGKVVNADPDNDSVEVAWDDGTTSWVPNAELDKA